jgi:hypothetical protein
MLYGAQIWGVQSNGQQLPQSQILERIQNKCLRQIAGAYKRTPIAALERETDISPLNLYLDTQAQQRQLNISEDPVEQATKALLQSIWQDRAPTRRHREGPSGNPYVAKSRPGFPTTTDSEENAANPSAACSSPATRNHPAAPAAPPTAPPTAPLTSKSPR